MRILKGVVSHPTILELRRLKNKDCEFEVRLGFIARPCHNENQNRKTKRYMKILIDSKKYLTDLISTEDHQYIVYIFTVYIFTGISHQFYNLEGTKIEMKWSQFYDRSASISMVSIEFQFDMVETLFYRLSLNYLEYFI